MFLRKVVVLKKKWILIACLLSFISPLTAATYAIVTNPDGNSLGFADISDPTNPIAVATLSNDDLSNDGFNAPQGIAISGNYAFVANSGGTSISVVDISDPSNPVYKTTLSDSNFSTPTNIAISGNYAYVTNYGSPEGSSLSVVNITDPLHPVYETTFTDGFEGAYGIAISGTYAFVSDNTANTLSPVNIEDPTHPSEGTVLEAPSFDGPCDIAISGNNAFVINIGTLSAINISDPGSPTEAGYLQDLLNFQLSSTIAVSGQYAFVPGVFSKGFPRYSLLNVVDTASLSIVGSVTDDGLAGPLGIAIKDSYAFVVNTTGTLSVVNIVDPENPVYETTLDFSFLGRRSGWGIAIVTQSSLTASYQQGAGAGLRFTYYKLKWEPFSGAAYYQVLRNGVSLSSKPIAGTTFSDTAINPAGRYTYEVRAYASGGVLLGTVGTTMVGPQ